MKKRILLLVLSVLILGLSIGIFVSAADGDEPVAVSTEPTPELSFYGASLVLNNSVDIRYLATAKNVADIYDVKMLVWVNAPTEYKKGTESYVVNYEGTSMSSGGTKYYCFDFKNAGMKRMANDFYTVMYIKTDSGEYYSSPAKYSILNYAYSKLGKTGTATTDAKLKKLLNNMLLYGESAQEYSNYKVDRLPTDDFYQVKVSGGKLSDGFTSGLYLTGDGVTINAAATAADGKHFAYWKNSLGASVSTQNSYTFSVGTKNEVYTAVYECKHEGTWTVVTAATCNTPGVEKQVCTLCFETLTREIPIDSTAHKMGAWTVSTAATCVDAGVEKRVCQNGCGKTETKTIAAIGHSVSAEYTHNSTEHWHDCLNEGCDYQEGKAAHTFDSVKCVVCGVSKWACMGDGHDTPVIPVP